VIRYDRRGRGDSGDIAIIAGPAGGRPATVFAWSSGGLLGLNAAQAGTPVARLALFEPTAVGRRLASPAAQ
jgi:pimeloyl-ACP methyl ester carboxylesterase